MRKMFNLLFVLFMIYYGMRIALGFLNKGHQVTYEVDGFSVNEIFTSHNKIESNNYYIEIKDGEDIYSSKIYVSNVTKNNIVNGITKLKGEKYSCLYIGYTNNLETDIICKNFKENDNILYSYSDIEKLDDYLDKQVNTTNYVLTDFIGDISQKSVDFVDVYYDNYVKNENVVLLTYKGFYYMNSRIDSHIRFANLYNKDVYKQDIYLDYDNYYIVPNYADTNTFNKFFVIDGKTGATLEISGENEISFDSFFQGGVGNKVYLIDSYNKSQYEIDLKKKTIELVGTLKSDAQMYNHETKNFYKENMQKVIDDKMTFDNEELVTDYKGTTYDKVYNVGNESVGYTMLYKKNGNYYDAYIIDNQNDSLIRYAFKTSKLTNIIYNKGNIYYVKDDKVRVYTHSSGNKPIFESKELINNSNLHYGVYNN